MSPAGLESLIAGGTTVVDGRGITPLKGRILLIRNGPSHCAIRYVAFARAGDAKAPTAFQDGEESTTARAEFWSEPERRVTPLKLAHAATTGFAKLVIVSHGNNAFRCGAAHVKWFYPTHTLVTDDDDVATRFAPTNWEEFGRIDFDDPDLQWFAIDRHREPRLLTVP